MPDIISPSVFADRAYYGYKDSKIPYSTLDCQAFVERVLSDCGVKINFRGSNDMWRHALQWSGTYDTCKLFFGEVPVGAWLFTLKFDGKEKERGYNDEYGNAVHVGIYTGRGKGAMHSSTGGVQECNCPDLKRWTHVGWPVFFPPASGMNGEGTALDKIVKLASMNKDFSIIIEELKKELEGRL